MNIYVIVEGEKATKKIYQNWISYTNSQLTSIDNLHDFKANNYFIFAGHGQSEFPDKVKKAIEDVNNISSINRLVVGIDSEDKEYDEKLSEVKKWVEEETCSVEVKYIIQHFCLETWFLGNKTLFRKKPQDSELISYFNIFDVRSDDPEYLPAHNQEGFNRAKFSYRYLRAGIRDIHGTRKCYSKSNPGIVLENGFYSQVKERCIKVNHIKSFNSFLEAFT